MSQSPKQTVSAQTSVISNRLHVEYEYSSTLRRSNSNSRTISASTVKARNRNFFVAGIQIAPDVAFFCYGSNVAAKNHLMLNRYAVEYFKTCIGYKR